MTNNDYMTKCHIDYMTRDVTIIGDCNNDYMTRCHNHCMTRCHIDYMTRDITIIGDSNNEYMTRCHNHCMTRCHIDYMTRDITIIGDCHNDYMTTNVLRWHSISSGIIWHFRKHPDFEQEKTSSTLYHYLNCWGSLDQTCLTKEACNVPIL